MVETFTSKKEIKFALLFLIIFSVLHFSYSSIRGTKLETLAIDIITVIPSVWFINNFSPEEQIVAKGEKLVSPFGSITILNGCEGFESMFLLFAAIAAFKACWKKKLLGLFVGLSIIYFLNQMRIVVLYFCFRYRKEWFDPIHSQIGPTLIILIACLFFLAWATMARASSTEDDLAR
ncbi:MAG: exosortase/archaeosortase family protein [Gammaproteobacteria bacterium]|nr:MAG: exosortase/archaeosortase family protein [Gammaproteobacteria bacterium]